MQITVLIASVAPRIHIYPLNWISVLLDVMSVVAIVTLISRAVFSDDLYSRTKQMQIVAYVSWMQQLWKYKNDNELIG